MRRGHGPYTPEQRLAQSERMKQVWAKKRREGKKLKRKPKPQRRFLQHELLNLARLGATSRLEQLRREMHVLEDFLRRYR